MDKTGTRYEKFAEPIPTEVMQRAVVDGAAIYDKPKDKGGKRIGTIIDGQPVPGFMTPSGKIGFYNPDFAGTKDAAGNFVDPLPVYKPRDWQPDVNYPLYLTNWKEATHTHTRSQNNAWLLDIKPANPLIIHPDTAAQRGLRDGNEVWVESRYARAGHPQSLRPHSSRSGRRTTRFRPLENGPASRRSRHEIWRPQHDCLRPAQRPRPTQGDLRQGLQSMRNNPWDAPRSSSRGF